VLFSPPKRFSRFFKSSKFLSIGKIFGGNAFAILCGFGSSVVLARWIGPSQQGVMAVLLTYPLLVQQVTELGIRQVAAMSIGQKDQVPGVITVTVIYLWCLTGLMGAAIVFGSLFLFPPQGSFWGDHLLAALLLPTLCAQSYAGGVFIGSKRIGSFTGTRWIPSFAQFLFFLVSWWLIPPHVTWALFARFFALGLSSVVFYFLILRAVPKPWGRPDFQIAKTLVLKGFEYGLSMGLSLLQYRLGILTLEWWSSPQEIGFFSIAQQNAEILFQIPQAFGIVVLMDSLSSFDSVLSTKKAMKSIRQVIWLSAGLALVTMIIGPKLILLVYGAPYAETVPCFLAFLPGVVAIMAFKIGRFDLVGQGRPWVGTPFVLLGLGVNVLLAYWLVPLKGALGAGIATSVGYTVVGFGFFWIYKKIHLKAINSI